MYRPLSDVIEALEAERDIELPMDPEYYERLHSRIMAAVEKKSESIAPPPWFEKPGTKVSASLSWGLEPLETKNAP